MPERSVRSYGLVGKTGLSYWKVIFRDTAVNYVKY